MHDKQPRPVWTLIAALTVFGVLAYLANSFPPTSSVLIGVFLLLLDISFSLLFTFLLNNTRRGILIGGGVVTFFLLRLLGLRSPLYVILLLVVLASLELTWKKR